MTTDITITPTCFEAQLKSSDCMQDNKQWQQEIKYTRHIERCVITTYQIHNPTHRETNNYKYHDLNERQWCWRRHSQVTHVIFTDAQECFDDGCLRYMCLLWRLRGDVACCYRQWVARVEHKAWIWRMHHLWHCSDPPHTISHRSVKALSALKSTLSSYTCYKSLQRIY